MVSLTTFAKRFDNLKPFIQKRSLEILMQNEKYVLDMVRAQQLSGKGRDDKTMQTGYSAGYGKRRKAKGLQTKFVDLHFTDRFHKSLDLVPVKGNVDIQSTEPYGHYVKANFPTSAGLTKVNAEIVAKIIVKQLAPDIKKYLVA